MTDAALWTAWQFWMAVATLIVIVAAGLLVAILVTAKQILAEAARALAAVEIIRRQTQPIWALQSTNEVAERILHTVEAIEAKGGALAQALAGQPAGKG